jgi:hypothetical protein
MINILNIFSNAIINSVYMSQSIFIHNLFIWVTIFLVQLYIHEIYIYNNENDGIIFTLYS